MKFMKKGILSISALMLIGFVAKAQSDNGGVKGVRPTLTVVCASTLGILRSIVLPF